MGGKKLLILTRYPNEYEPKRLKEEAEEIKLSVKLLSYRQVALKNQKVLLGEEEDPLSLFDYLILRAASKPKSSLVTIKTALLEALGPNQVCLNQETFRRFPLTSKVFQNFILARAGLPTVNSWILSHPKRWDKFLKKADFPLIIKGAFGSHGRQVFVASSIGEARRIIEKENLATVIFQPLIPSPFWLRSLVLGKKFLGAVKRETKQRFRLLKKRVKSCPKKADDNQIARLSQKAAEVLQADFVGVDLVYNRNHWEILEVNRTPQFRIFEKKTGVNVASQIIEFLSSFPNNHLPLG